MLAEKLLIALKEKTKKNRYGFFGALLECSSAYNNRVVRSLKAIRLSDIEETGSNIAFYPSAHEEAERARAEAELWYMHRKNRVM